MTGRAGFPGGTRGSGRKTRPGAALPGTPRPRGGTAGTGRDGTGGNPKSCWASWPFLWATNEVASFHLPVVTCAAWQLLWACLCSVGASPCPGNPEHGSGLGKAGPRAKGLLQRRVLLSVSPVQQRCLYFLSVKNAFPVVLVKNCSSLLGEIRKYYFWCSNFIFGEEVCRNTIVLFWKLFIRPQCIFLFCLVLEYHLDNCYLRTFSLLTYHCKPLSIPGG